MSAAITVKARRCGVVAAGVTRASSSSPPQPTGGHGLSLRGGGELLPSRHGATVRAALSQRRSQLSPPLHILTIETWATSSHGLAIGLCRAGDAALLVAPRVERGWVILTS